MNYKFRASTATRRSTRNEPISGLVYSAEYQDHRDYSQYAVDTRQR